MWSSRLYLDISPTNLVCILPGRSDDKGPRGLPWWLQWWRIHLQCRRPGFDPWVGKIPWRRAWQPSPVLLPGESCGQRSLVGCSPQGHKESDMTEQLSTAEDPREGSPLPWKLNTTSFTGNQLISLSRLWAPRLTYRIVLIIYTLSPSPFSLWVVVLWCL